jgi:SAM-dependent methyltransferase
MNDQFDVNQYWLNRGRTYLGESRLFQDYHRQQEQFLIETLRRSGIEPGRILELGCGFGRITRLLANNFPEARVLALDLSPEQLANAQRYCSGLTRVEFHPYDFYSGQALPGGPADLAVAIEVFLHHPPELIRSLLGRVREAARFLVHIDWYETWDGPLPPHVWMHDFPAYYRELGWRFVSLPFPRKIDGNQQVLFLAGASLPPECQTLAHVLDSSRQASSPLLEPVPTSLGSESSWERRLAAAVQELCAVVPERETFILIDGDEWGISQYPGSRGSLPFLEKEGRYWGPPSDDAVAWEELERLRRTGASYLAVGWNAFWWLDHYLEWTRRVREHYRCLVDNEQLVVFQLKS